IPAPELIIAGAALQTKNIKLAPMAHILPHQRPARLATMIGWLSQVLEGRYFLGIGAGAYPQSSYLHGIRNAGQSNTATGGDETKSLSDMVLEALFIMEKIWKRVPCLYEGKYWDVGYP